MDVYEIAVLPGDGIGPEVVDAALHVLDAVATSHGIELRYSTHPAGAKLYEESGVAIARDTLAALGDADAILLGAMGLPEVRRDDGTEITPQLDIREHFHLFASLRPARLFDGLARTTTSGDVDMLVIRETTEGMFAHRHSPTIERDAVSDRLTITRETSEQLFELAFQQAHRRRTQDLRGHVTLIDKSNVLASFAFLRRVFDEVASRYPDVETDRLYVDAAAMLMVREPERFDVVVTENLLGDILSELAAGIAGGIGLAPSADVGNANAVFQPCHGSAPDIAGTGKANPVATVLSAAMLLDWLADRNNDPPAANAARSLRQSVAAVLEHGPSTPDLGGEADTDQMTRALTEALPDPA